MRSLARTAALLAVPLLVSSLRISSASAETKPASDSLPQIVRLSYIEGDVRLERGKLSGPNPTGWVTAKSGVPVESGYSLVTGDGRAEIEFEDSSTAYVDANSAVTFNQLTTLNGAPQTAVTLLTGTMTLSLTTQVRGEHYLILTPEHTLSIPYPDRVYARVDSFLDGMDVTPLSELPVRVSSGTSRSLATSGHTLHYLKTSLPTVTPAAAGDPGFSDWVQQRLNSRALELREVMTQSGLDGPVPGLADLDGEGQFFPCAPYGTCWAPTGGWMGANARSLRDIRWDDDTEFFPCWTGRYHDLVGTDPVTRQRRVLYSELDGDLPYYDWAVCHAGWWIRSEGHRGWVWVVGKKLHHRCPVRYVQAGGRKGYVPMHPRDVKGMPPENLKHGLYTVADKHAGAIEHVAWNSTDPLKVLPEAPKDFRREAPLQLASATPPKLEAHLEAPHLGPVGIATAHGEKLTAEVPHGSTLTFNAKSQTFMLSSQQDHNGHITSVAQPIGGRADAAVGHGGAVSATGFAHNSGGGFSGGASGVSRGGGASGSSGGASSHGGGGSSSSSFSGGGSHGGSSGGGSSGGGSSGGSSSGGSSSGGGHH